VPIPETVLRIRQVRDIPRTLTLKQLGGLLMTLEYLVNQLADCIGAQSEATDSSDAAAGNDYAKGYIAAFDRIRATQTKGVRP
jgi:hypothetical protein